MYKFVVVWKDPQGLEVYDPFNDEQEAYDYMLYLDESYLQARKE